MIRRLLISCCALAVLGGFIDPPRASAQQSINLFVGGFVPRSFSDRGRDDVLFANTDALLFNIKDFRGATAGAEYLVWLGDFFDAGLGVGIYSRTSPAIYRDFVRPDNSEIEQDLKLRIVPFTATIRYLPLGHHDAIEPYIGGGVGIYRWRYSETGDFLDVNNNIFRDTFVGTGTTVGPVILGGVRVPVGRVGLGGEIRYQGGKGDLPPEETFAASKINLGGFNYLFTMNIKF
jgi:hypothetical protein